MVRELKGQTTVKAEKQLENRGASPIKALLLGPDQEFLTGCLLGVDRYSIQRQRLNQ